MQFSIASRMFLCLPGIDYGMYKVLLQNTFQSSMPLLNAFFGLRLVGPGCIVTVVLQFRHTKFRRVGFLGDN